MTPFVYLFFVCVVFSVFVDIMVRLIRYFLLFLIFCGFQYLYCHEGALEIDDPVFVGIFSSFAVFFWH